MFVRRALALVLATLWLWPASLHAQSEALMEAYRQGKALKEAGRYEQAIPFYRKALELGEREFGPDHSTTATLLNNLAELYVELGRYEEAEPLIKRALAVREKTLAPDHPDVANSLNSLALMYDAQGRYDSAEPLFKRALAIIEKEFGHKRPFAGAVRMVHLQLEKRWFVPNKSRCRFYLSGALRLAEAGVY